MSEYPAWVVVPGAWSPVEARLGPSVTLPVRWVGVRCVVSRLAVSRDGHGLDIEDRMNRDLVELMHRIGVVPIGPAVLDIDADNERFTLDYRLRQRAIDDQDPIWIAVRSALNADQTWLANPVDEGDA
jgi:hypothetical protein